MASLFLEKPSLSLAMPTLILKMPGKEGSRQIAHVSSRTFTFLFVSTSWLLYFEISVRNLERHINYLALLLLRFS